MNARNSFDQSAFWLPPSYVRRLLHEHDDDILAALRTLSESRTLFPVLVQPLAGFFVLAVIQLALSAPDLPPIVADTARAFAEGLQDEIRQLCPELEPLMIAGWHRECDEPLSSADQPPTGGT